MGKKQLRQAIREKKKSLGAEALVQKSLPAMDKVTANAEYQKACRVMLYYPLWDEVDTRPLIARALEDGKRVILPTVVGDDIIPVEVTKQTEWVKGPFGIMEPVAECYEGEIDFILVPGVAFDRNMNRLGRGKGYYDRFLVQHSAAYRLGICFDFQVVTEIPTEPFDFKMNDLLVI